MENVFDTLCSSLMLPANRWSMPEATNCNTNCQALSPQVACYNACYILICCWWF
jgi:hypothetical protein